ncbi:MAG: hypothetical protein LC104_06090 [Bacteroidales bacterium]|nr:hypothetical protein [Bacteroidales bacterium]
MITSQHASFSISTRMWELADILDRDWDTEFDTVYDDLEREFAELRLQMNHVE